MGRRLHGERDVLDVEVREVPNVVGDRGAAGAGMFVCRLEHVVVDDQLPAPLEHVEEGRGAVRAGDREPSVDLDHRQAPALRRERVASAVWAFSSTRSSSRARCHSSALTTGGTGV